MGRFVGGVRGIRLRADDEVVGLEVLQPNSSILTICANGYGKRTQASEYRITNRGGMGVINIKTTKRNGQVIAILDVLESDEVITISEMGVTIRSKIADTREISRATQGVRLMNLQEGDQVAAVARIEEDKEPEGADVEGEDENGDAGEEPATGNAPDA
jgi:DNA gyrase subunit A